VTDDSIVIRKQRDRLLFDVPYVAPGTPLEQRIATVWAEVLDVDRVGVDDNFFDLGGDSLLATRVAARLRDAFDVEIPLRSFFDAPTIAELAPCLSSATATTESLDTDDL
jgi:acyl carrier protein